ncbi:MAG: radical SAM family heme chaperone HemW [Coriobacteriia bacterium]|nr:radical SAM family heme chaperone HemW [Coriobacteriia bacterium]
MRGLVSSSLSTSTPSPCGWCLSSSTSGGEVRELRPIWQLDEGFEPYRALYLHLPFCRKRCAYCDFVTEAASPDDPRLDAYVDQLVADIRAASAAGALAHIETVYLGGGTPSFFGLKRLCRLMYELSLCMRLEPEIECTMEANPDSLTLPMVRDLFALGVTRISLGVQSFDDDELRLLGRIHDAQAALRAIDLALERFDHVSIDLMCGLPGQHLETFERSLDRALSTGVDHISIYPLTIEEGTPLDHLVEKGLIPTPDDDLAADMMDLAACKCTEAGFRRYEVASYARPGGESRHNQAYWTGVPYLGLGRGAVGMKQSSDCRIRYDQEGIIEELDEAQRLVEDLMLGMRRSVGVAADDVIAACLVVPDAWEIFEALVDDGFAAYRDGRFVPTERGWLLGNVMYGRILDLAP